MKNIFKLMAAFAATALLIPACNVDNVNATYTDYSNSEVTFSQSVIVATELSADATSFAIELSRNNAKDAVTVSIDNSKVPAEFNCPNSVSFAAGEYKAELVLNISNLAVGTKVAGSVAILTPEAVNANVATAITVDFTLAKAYTWVSLGIGTFTDYFVCGGTHPSEILKAEGFDIYRAVDPYKECLTIDDAGNGDWIAFNNRCAFIEFSENADGSVNFKAFDTGLLYEATDGQNIVAHPYTDFSGIESDASCRVDSKTFVLAPYYYINGVGGWDYTQEATVVIELP